MKKTTDELLKILKNSPSLPFYLEEEKEQLSACSLHDYLSRLCADKNISAAACIKASGLDRTYAYQIFSGAKVPSRDKVLALCFGFALTFEEVQTLLKATGYPALYAKAERDCVIIFAFQRNLSLLDANELLLTMNFDIIQ